MRIAILHYAAPPVVGGVERVLAAHANLLADRGHTVQVLAARGEAWRADVSFVGLPLIDSTNPEILRAKRVLETGRLPDDFENLRARIEADLAQVLDGVDVLVAHNVASLAKNLPLTAALHALTQQPGAPALVLWHHDLAWTTPRYRAELHDGSPWDLLRTDWPWATQVVVSELRREELRVLLGVPAERIHVVPNGVDLNEFYKLEPESARLVERLGLLDAAPLLLLPVRLTPRKNVELALGTLAALRAGAFPQAQLLVTGPLGPHNPANAAYLARLQAQRQTLGLDDSAHFLAEQVEGVLPDTMIADFFRLADVLFFPSREEGFGIPMLEAALSHLPVFCADIAPLRALGGPDAVYFSPDAGASSVAALLEERLLALPTYRFAVRARVFTWAQIAARWLVPLLEQAAEARSALPSVRS